MNQQLKHLAFVLGGELGTVTTHLLAMPVSASTLLRLTRTTEDKDIGTVRILGIDDWANKKRHHYGTILVDLERHEVIDLLPDRSAETLANWLKAHSEVELITRDRWRNYAEAVHSALPNAVQVADRFHLIRNLVDALKKIFDRKGPIIRDAARELALEKQGDSAESTIETTEPQPVDLEAAKSWQELRFEEVKKLQAQGVSIREIARQLKIHRNTIRKYFQLESYQPRPITPQSTLKAAPYMDYMMKRWNDGVHNYTTIYKELVEKFEYDGSYGGVTRAMGKLFKNGTLKAPVKVPQLYIPRLSAQSAAWLMIKEKDKLKDDKRRLRTILCEKDIVIAQAFEMAQAYCKMFRQRLEHELDGWLEKAAESGIKEFKSFAISLRSDMGAVRASLTYEWSNGQVEGQVHRLKLIKRQMYGRANFDLLRLRVMYKPSSALDHQK